MTTYKCVHCGRPLTAAPEPDAVVTPRSICLFIMAMISARKDHPARRSPWRMMFRSMQYSTPLVGEAHFPCLFGHLGRPISDNPADM